MTKTDIHKKDITEQKTRIRTIIKSIDNEQEILRATIDDFNKRTETQKHLRYAKIHLTSASIQLTQSLYQLGE